eukprot:gene885-11489_t
MAKKFASWFKKTVVDKKSKDETGRRNATEGDWEDWANKADDLR